MAATEDEILDAEVLYTIVGGEIRYQRDRSTEADER
jgi:hypothetical protein